MIQGPLQPKNITIDGSLSSQFLTGLLLAYAAAPVNNPDSNKVSIKVNDLKSKPYIDLTLDVMKRFGLNVPENKNYEEFVFTYDASNNSPKEEGVEATEPLYCRRRLERWCILLVAGAIAGNITVRGLSMASTQADKKITEALMAANAGIAIDAKVSGYIQLI